MQDAVFVRKGDRAGELRDECRRFARFVSKVIDSRGQCVTLRELHAVERGTITFAHGVNRQDVFVIETRRRFRFRTESRDRSGRADLARQYHLQRDDPRGNPLPRTINNAHAAAGNLGHYFVIPDRGARDANFRIMNVQRRRQKAR